MSKRIIAHLFSTDPDFTDWPINCQSFIDLLRDVFDLPTISFINYLTDEFAERDGCNFKSYLLNCDVSDTSDEEHIMFIHSNVNDPKLMYAIDVFAQFCGLCPLKYHDVAYGKDGEIVFVANHISDEINGYMFGSYIANRGWCDEWKSLPKTTLSPCQYKPILFDMIDDYTKHLIEHHRAILPTSTKFGRVLTLCVIIGNVPDDSAYYYNINNVCAKINIRFGDTGCWFPRLRPWIIRYSDFPDVLNDEDGSFNANDYAFMWATPDCDGMGLTDSESETCERIVHSMYDSDSIVSESTTSIREKPNGDKIILIGPSDSFVERINDAEKLMSDIMCTFFDERTD